MAALQVDGTNPSLGKRKARWTQLIPSLVIVVLIVECILLMLQNRELRRTINTMTTVGQVEPLRPGDRVESFDAQTLDGTGIHVRYLDSSARYLFFVLSTTCPHCAKMLPVWHTIAKNQPENLNIMGISPHGLDATKEYVTKNNIAFYTLCAESDTSFPRKYKIAGVPETILVNGDGIVEKTWVGELSTEQANEIQTLMGGKKSFVD